MRLSHKSDRKSNVLLLRHVLSLRNKSQSCLESREGDDTGVWMPGTGNHGATPGSDVCLLSRLDSKYPELTRLLWGHVFSLFFFFCTWVILPKGDFLGATLICLENLTEFLRDLTLIWFLSGGCHLSAHCFPIIFNCIFYSLVMRNRCVFPPKSKNFCITSFINNAWLKTCWLFSELIFLLVPCQTGKTELCYNSFA